MTSGCQAGGCAYYTKSSTPAAHTHAARGFAAVEKPPCGVHFCYKPPNSTAASCLYFTRNGVDVRSRRRSSRVQPDPALSLVHAEGFRRRKWHIEP